MEALETTDAIIADVRERKDALFRELANRIIRNVPVQTENITLEH